MAAPIQSDLTRGPILGHLRALAVPGAFAMLFNTLYNVTDMFFAGLLSTSAQAGLALGFQAFFVAMSVGIGLSAAMGALVGHALGRKDRAAARRIAEQGILFGFAVSAALILAGAVYAPWVIEAVSEPGEYRDAGIRYYAVLSLSLPAFLVAFGCNGILQAHGDGRSNRRALGVACLANVALNPLCMFGIPGLWGGLGFDGLAFSTLISQCGVLAYMLARVAALETMRGPFRARIDWAAWGEIVRQALPTSFAFLVMILAAFVVQFALKGFGEHAIAGYGIAIRLEQILLLPVLGVTQALLPIAAQNFGAGDGDRVRETFWTGLRIGFAMTLAALPVIWLLGGPVLRLFTDDPEVVRVGLLYLRVESLILPAYMAHFAITSLLQALKRPIWTLWISLYRQAFGIAFFVWLFVGLWGFGEVGVWLGVAAAVLTGLVIAFAIAAEMARREIGGLWPVRRVAA